VQAPSTVVIHFHVPVPPLVLDSSWLNPWPYSYDPWNAGGGFELLQVTDAGVSNMIQIAKVEVGVDTVTITTGPSGGPGGLYYVPNVVAYADTAAPDCDGARRCGQMHDSDTFAGPSGTPQPNALWEFRLPLEAPDGG
jgi:hypothetical protein